VKEQGLARDDRGEAAPKTILNPQISLLGEVTEAMAQTLRDELRDVGDGRDPIAIEVTTLGGDAEMARRMVLDVEAARERLKPRRLVFVGKTVVYSAGVTLMSAFPCENRYLTADATLLIHVRQLDKKIEISGPMRASLPQVRAVCHQIETGIRNEEENFKRLLAGSRLSLDELVEKALYNWYVPAKEALELGLIAGIL
jgi:ATP-dependent protease ClpP protease subunit